MNGKKKIVRLTESQLQNIVQKTMKKILKEGSSINQNFRDKYPLDDSSYDVGIAEDRDYVIEEILNRTHKLITAIVGEVNNVLSEYGAKKEFDEICIYDFLNDAVDQILKGRDYNYGL